MTGTDLRTARKAAGLTQALLAARWGISKRTIIRWERGDDSVPAWVTDALEGVAATPPA